MYMFVKDPYCYSCHQKSGEIFCSNCFRSYCEHCARNNEIFVPPKLIEKCYQCTQLEDCRLRWISGIAFKPMRRELIRDLFTRGVFNNFTKVPLLLQQPDSFFGCKIDPDHTPFTFISVVKKIRNLEYACSEELVIDLKTILHILQASPVENFRKSKEVRKASEYLERAFVALNLSDSCAYCLLNLEEDTPQFLKKYEEISPYFITPCPYPHVLVLAKYAGYPPWPAKLIRYLPEKEKVHVIFFGTHDTAYLMPQAIFHARDPESYADDYEKFREEKNYVLETNMLIKFDIAVRELKAHIKHLKLYFPNQIKLSEKFKRPWLPTDSVNYWTPNDHREKIAKKSERELGDIEMNPKLWSTTELKKRAISDGLYLRVKLKRL